LTSPSIESREPNRLTEEGTMSKSQPAGAISHVELISKDPAKTIRFYEKVFGWKFDDTGGDYWFTAPPALPTGALRGPQEGERPGALSYIEVKDIAQTLKDAEAAGGQVIVAKSEIPNMGHYAVFVAPGEVPQGIFQSG
jgi:predicted enzyme related to lactoylglutathione lyase